MKTLIEDGTERGLIDEDQSAGELAIAVPPRRMRSSAVSDKMS